MPPTMDFVRFADFIRDVREFDFVAVGIESVVFFFGGFAVGGFDGGDWLSGEGERPDAAGEEVESEAAENEDGDSDKRFEPFWALFMIGGDLFHKYIIAYTGVFLG